MPVQVCRRYAESVPGSQSVRHLNHGIIHEQGYHAAGGINDAMVPIITRSPHPVLDISIGKCDQPPCRSTKGAGE